MSVMDIIVTFTIVWWVIFFMVLPFGVKVNVENNRKSGFASSSPENSLMIRKILITTFLSMLLTTIYYFL